MNRASPLPAQRAATKLIGDQELPTKAISLWAPWVWAIFHSGKNVENRGFGFPKITGSVWLHASLWPGTRKPLNAAQQHELRDEFQTMMTQSGQSRDQFPPLTLGELDGFRGKILGRVTIIRHVTEFRSVWYVPGSLGLLLEDAKPLREPVPAVGAQGVWTVPESVLTELRRAE